MEAGKRLQKNGHRIRASSIANYHTLLKHLLEYQAQKQIDLVIKDWDELDTRAKKSETAYWKKFYLGFTEYLFKEKNQYDNNVGAQMKLLRAFFTWLMKEMILIPGPYHHYFYKTHEDIPVIVLSPERLNFLIHNKLFEALWDKRLRRIKNLFVFGCTTALRFSDLIHLKPANIETNGGNKYIYVCSQKTQTCSRVYLPQYAKDILAKYKRRKRTLFPPITLSNFNLAIKQLGEYAGWTEDIVKTRNKRGEAIIQYRDKAKQLNFRFCDVLSSHTMRRTAITTFLRMGMHETNVRMVSVHKAHSASFYRYVFYADSFMDEETDKVFAKLQTIDPSK
jgi:integrase